MVMQVYVSLRLLMIVILRVSKEYECGQTFQSSGTHAHAFLLWCRVLTHVHRKKMTATNKWCITRYINHSYYLFKPQPITVHSLALAPMSVLVYGGMSLTLPLPTEC